MICIVLSSEQAKNGVKCYEFWGNNPDDESRMDIWISEDKTFAINFKEVVLVKISNISEDHCQECGNPLDCDHVDDIDDEDTFDLKHGYHPED